MNHVCRLCGKFCQRPGRHLATYHSEITKREYYDDYLAGSREFPTIGKCDNCGKPTKWLGDRQLDKGYERFCSNGKGKSPCARVWTWAQGKYDDRQVLEERPAQAQAIGEYWMEAPESRKEQQREVHKKRCEAGIAHSRSEEGRAWGRKLIALYGQPWKSYPTDTLKAGHLILKSSYEVEFARQLDEDNTVETFIYEGLAIRYWGPDNHYHWYHPDFIVYYTNGVQKIIEVKSSDKLDDKWNILKFRAGRHIMHKYGIPYEVLTEKEIFREVS